MENKRTGFSSRLGFVLAAAGSAVGLGNIWRFPYLSAKYGGGIFLLVYLILAVTLGFILMITEISIGRKTGKSVIHAFSSLNKKSSIIGYLAALVPIIIFPYYCVIGGWVIKYVTVCIENKIPLAAADGYFDNFIGGVKAPIIFLLIFIFITSLVVMLGVKNGIETVSKILMPILIIMTIVISIYSLTLDGAISGIKYYLLPDFSRFSIKTVIAAMGQLFYSMSLAMGIMITYGSYMRKSDPIEKSVRNIEVFDTGVAFLSGLMIVPAVFAFSNGDENALNAGAGLMFVTLPKVFNSMPAGEIMGALFFILVFFAALTSAISIMETIVSIFSDKFKIKRKTLCIIIMLSTMVLAIPSTLGYSLWSDITIFGYSILDFFDFLSNNILMPIIAFLTCIFVGFIVKPHVVTDEIELTEKFKSKKYYSTFIKFIAPACLLVIFASSIFGIV